MALRSMEGQIEEYVEGLMARAFRSGLQPVEIGRRLRRVAVRDRRVSVKGVGTAANRFVISLSEADHDRIIAQGTSITLDLVDEVRAAVRREGLVLAGPVQLELAVDPDRRRGTFSIHSSFDDAPTISVPALIELSDGQTIELDRNGLTVGRHDDNDIVIDETNVSRFHAQIHATPDGWALADSGSTNGTSVNGRFEGQCTLNDGDLISIGPATLTFRLQ